MKKLVGDGRRTREIFDFIVDFMEEFGYAPSCREVISGTSFTSMCGVNYHIKRLIELGYLSRPRKDALVVTGMKMKFNGDRP